jgi:signal transduction histidine kinase
MLIKDLQDGRQDKIEDDFQRIANAADKMHTLLSDLLELSRVGRIINLPEEVDLAQVIREAIETLDAHLRSKKVIVNSPLNLPIMYGDRVRLREVFENLIDNAAKYMGDQPNPMIEIGIKDDGNETVIFVKDNGIGIEPQYQKKVFGLFDKLNSASEGTGIGLALIKRIIETHGGRIWVESEGLGKGSIFYFTIPDARNAK